MPIGTQNVISLWLLWLYVRKRVWNHSLSIFAHGLLSFFSCLPFLPLLHPTLKPEMLGARQGEFQVAGSYLPERRSCHPQRSQQDLQCWAETSPLSKPWWNTAWLIWREHTMWNRVWDPEEKSSAKTGRTDEQIISKYIRKRLSYNYSKTVVGIWPH